MNEETRRFYENLSDMLEGVSDRLDEAGVLPHDDLLIRVDSLVDRMHSAEVALAQLKAKVKAGVA